MTALLAVLAVAAGCGGERSALPDVAKAIAAKARACAAGSEHPLGSAKVAYAAVVTKRARAYRRPGQRPFVTFGRLNVNGVPTALGILGAVKGYVRARDVWVGTVHTRIVVDLSDRRVTFFRKGREVVQATAPVGAPATPTPTGRYYVNQRLAPEDKSGPFGPGAIGISAFSNVLTGWAQGGPIAIHGTNQPWSIGRAVSNGCLRLDNKLLKRLFAATPAGTPVIIRA